MYMILHMFETSYVNHRPYFTNKLSNSIAMFYDYNMNSLIVLK